MPDTEALLARLFSGADRYVELDQIVMAEIEPQFLKVARIVSTALRAIGHQSRSARLYGEIGNDEPDLYLEAILARVASLAAAGVLEVHGDLSDPQHSEVRLREPWKVPSRMPAE